MNRTTGESSRDVLHPKPEDVAELGRIRRRELQSLTDRLGRVEARPRSRVWNGAGAVLVSTSLGALLAGIPLLSSTADWDDWVIPVYAAAIGVALLVGGLCFRAARSMRDERADSVADIKTDLDRLLAAYEQPGAQAEHVDPAEIRRIETELIRESLREIRSEARENLQLLQRAVEQGRYWKMTETGLTTKQWKRNQPLLRGERTLEGLLDSGQHVANEVERIATSRAFAALKFNRRIDSEDRLPEVIELLRTFDSDLTKTLEEQDDEAER